ncbi:MAG: DNA adenine methylase [Deferribacteraceae bacterium]|jgi:adenine-specific DNA-methyltransferase|nr:DNA adenine methylase [Deferribacteraceae bacterium]
MNYIGSKHSLLDFLERCIKKVAGNDRNRFCDLFAGTGAVGRHFKKLGFSVIANDLQYYAFVLNKHYVENHTRPEFINLDEVPDAAAESVCKYLSHLAPKKGFVFNNYAGGSGRLYFSDENAGKCDAVRGKIEEWHTENKITDGEYYFLLTTLLENIDRHANTASVYGAFLKKLKPSAQKVFDMNPADLLINNQEHKVFNRDANRLIREIETDILYLDPPYNERQYASNYHLLETIAKYDSPKINGKTGLRDYNEQKSDYCRRAKVCDAFADLIRNANAKYIFLSYNNEGLLPPDYIRKIMSSRGEYGFFTQEYNRFKADSDRIYSANRTTEYLHWVKVEN